MIDFHPEILAKLSKQRGQQAVLLLEIDWLEGSTVTYSDTEFPGSSPYLISASQISRRDGSQVSNSIDIVLDATNDAVETTFRSLDIHLRPVRLYIGFPGVEARALLFEGLINSQVSWDDQGRTLQFQVLTRLEDSLVGFAMEDGYFPVVAPEDRAKVWPLPFGTVCHYEAQRLSTTIKGFLVEGQGVVDPTLANRICQIGKTECPTVTVQGYLRTRQEPDKNCLARKRNEGCILKDLLARQQETAKGIIEIRNGEAFPQNKTISLRAGGVQYRGVMSGNLFTITGTIHPDEDKVAQCRNVRPESIGFRYGLGSEEEANKCTNQGSGSNILPIPGRDCIVGTSMGIGGNFVSTCGQNAGGSTLQERVVGGAGDSWAYYDQMPTGRYIFLPAGTEVVLSEYDDDLIYMVSLVPGTVTQVVAYRQFGDLRLLTQVPTDWYSVVNVDYGDYQCVELRFNTLPSASDEDGWSDDIYVSFVSSVGPNPVDIIQWLIENYTSYTVDAANFASVKTKLTNFPSHFVVTDRPSVLKLIQDIAYQARMATRIVDGVYQLVFLSEEPTSLRTLTAADVVLGTFDIEYTRTEDLVTNHRITWQDQYTPQIQGEDVEEELAIRFNIPKYGSSEEEYDWYTQTTFETINKAATFWLIRKSNTWLEISFQTTIKHLDLDVLDCVTMNLTPQFPAGTKVVLKEKNYDPETNTISWKAWTPIRAGESAPYYWAWPSAVASGVFPLPDDGPQVGDGSGKIVIPPLNHPLRVGYVGGESVPVSSGDSFPSDVGFVAPTVNCQVPLGNEIKFSQVPIIDSLAKQQFNEDVSNKQQGNSGGVSTEKPREKAPCSFSGLNPCPPETSQIGDQSTDPPIPEDDEPGDCRYLVRLNYIVPYLIGVNCGGPCSTERVDGLPCSGEFITIESVMTSYDAALAAVTEHKALFEAVRCKANSGVPQPYVGTAIYSQTPDGNSFVDVKPPDGACGEIPIDFSAVYQPYLVSGEPVDGFDPGLIDPINPGDANGLV